MTGPAAYLHAALAWAHAQTAALAANIAAVVTDKPEPAMQTLIRTVVTIAIAWLALKVIKKVSK
jgi:uncharacterized membrane protein